MKYTKEVKKIIFDAIAAGDSHVQACVKAGIKEQTFYQWRTQKNEFAELVKKAHEKHKESLEYKLENALWKKATGYVETETETEYAQDKNGNIIVKRRKVREKHYSPDTAALIFALCNIAPHKWKNMRSIQSEDITDRPQEDLTEYHFEGITDDILCNIADALQDAKAEEESNKK